MTEDQSASAPKQDLNLQALSHQLIQHTLENILTYTKYNMNKLLHRGLSNNMLL